ncbi:hypothetical protein JCM11491_004521 [Sporobolomyces phaffii]
MSPLSEPVDYHTKKALALPNGETSGGQLVESLSRLESQSCRGINQLEKEHPGFCATVLRFTEVNAALSEHDAELGSLEQQKRCLPKVPKVWDNSANTKKAIESRESPIRREHSKLSHEHEQLSRRITAAELSYSRKSTGRVQRTLIEQYKSFSAQIARVEEQLKLYSKAVHYLKDQINYGNESVAENFSERELASVIDMLVSCAKLEQSMKKDLLNARHSVGLEHSISKPTLPTVGNHRRALIYSLH